MYAHQKVFHQISAAAFSSTGVKGFFSPGVVPMILRRVSVVISTQMTVTPPVLTIKHRPTAGSATGETTAATITTPVASVVGKVIYVENLNRKVSPGEHIAFDVTTAATAGAGDIVAEFEPQWERLANEADATASA